jgi:ADP-ribose pyrophosphatase
MSIQVIKKKIIHKGKFTTLWGTDFVAGGRTRVWEWLEKFDIVYVLPITKNGKYVFIKQFRFPINAYVLETPAGIIETGITFEELAIKELQEETGYTTDKPLEVLPKYPMCPALTNGFAYGFCARDVIKKSNQKLEDAEDIEIIELSKDELLNIIHGANTEYYIDPRLLGLIMMIESKNCM